MNKWITITNAGNDEIFIALHNDRINALDYSNDAYEDGYECIIATIEYISTPNGAASTWAMKDCVSAIPIHRKNTTR